MAAKMGIRLTPKFEAALQFATTSHEGQYRKGNRAPYISHPMTVAAIALECGASEEQAIAALLHDVIEDCDVPAEEIESRFGETVARLVVACTERLDKDMVPWRVRKQDYLDQIATAPSEAVFVMVCDKFHNLTSLVQDIRFRGESAWGIFKAPPEDIRWYYSELVLIFRARTELDGRIGALIGEFERLVASI